jgi:hypothetical protein
MMGKVAVVVGVLSLALAEAGCSAVMALSGKTTPDLAAAWSPHLLRDG